MLSPQKRREVKYRQRIAELRKIYPSPGDEPRQVPVTSADLIRRINWIVEQARELRADEQFEFVNELHALSDRVTTRCYGIARGRNDGDPVEFLAEVDHDTSA